MKAIIITPTCRETEDMIEDLMSKISAVQDALKGEGIETEHYFLSDGSKLGGLRALVRHESPEGLAVTLVEGYQAVLDISDDEDIVVRIDAQEHDPLKMIDGIKGIASGNEAVFLPVVHVEVNDGNKDMLIKEAERLKNALYPINKDDVMRLYNNVFPLGYQIFKAKALRSIIPILKNGSDIFERKFGVKPTWGIDLLAALIVARMYPRKFSLMFDPVASAPWLINKGADKSAEQSRRAEMMIEVAEELAGGQALQ